MKASMLAGVLMVLFALVLSGPVCGDDDDNDESSDSGDDDDTAADDDTSGADDDTPGDVTCDGDVCTDSSSGLMWQNEPDCCYDWEDAKTHCDALSWGGYTDWRLPSLSELRTLVRGCEATITGGGCEVTASCLDWDCRNSSCVGCDYYHGPGSEGRYLPGKMLGGGLWCWSSSAVADQINYAWYVDFNGATVQNRDVYTIAEVRCVR
jgi:Protein of unknown function (DUF1566)